ncbi:hypothetical protein NKG05_24905 [Oerskovia sp. M15]
MTRRKTPATSVAEMRTLLEATHRMRGLVASRVAIEQVVAGTDSSMETRTRMILTDAGLPRPAVNVPPWTLRGLHRSPRPVLPSTSDSDRVRRRRPPDRPGDVASGRRAPSAARGSGLGDHHGDG